MCTADLELLKTRGVLASLSIRTMAGRTALKEKSAPFLHHAPRARLVPKIQLPATVMPIDCTCGKCRDQDEYRRSDGCHCTLDFERGHYHGAPPPLKSSSPPKYPAAATNPDASNIKTRYRHSPVRDIASLTTSLHTAKATRRPKAGQTNR